MIVQLAILSALVVAGFAAHAVRERVRLHRAHRVQRHLVEYERLTGWLCEPGKPPALMRTGEGALILPTSISPGSESTGRHRRKDLTSRASVG